MGFISAEITRIFRQGLPESSLGAAMRARRGPKPNLICTSIRHRLFFVKHKLLFAAERPPGPHPNKTLIPGESEKSKRRGRDESGPYSSAHEGGELPFPKHRGSSP